MPGLVEWNRMNREFAHSTVGKTLEQKGCVWIMQETEKGRWKVRVLNAERVDLEDLKKQDNKWILEPANERF